MLTARKLLILLLHCYFFPATATWQFDPATGATLECVGSPGEAAHVSQSCQAIIGMVYNVDMTVELPRVALHAGCGIKFYLLDRRAGSRDGGSVAAPRPRVHAPPGKHVTGNFLRPLQLIMQECLLPSAQFGLASTLVGNDLEFVVEIFKHQ